MSAHYATCKYDDATGSYIPLEFRPINDALKNDDPLYQEGFQAGAASRDAEIADLTKQREELEFSWAGCSQQLKDACAGLDAVEQERDELRAQVLAQQARIEQLLEAVEYCCSQVQEFITVPGISKALSTPADLSALRAHDAAIWREAMQIAEDSRDKATMSKYSSVPEGRAARDMAEGLSKAYCHKADAIEKGGE